MIEDATSRLRWVHKLLHKYLGVPISHCASLVPPQQAKSGLAGDPGFGAFFRSLLGAVRESLILSISKRKVAALP
jgi:hypothetical protein